MPSKLSMEEFIFLKGSWPQSCNFTKDWVPLWKFFKSFTIIIGRPKSSRIEDLEALPSLLRSWMLPLCSLHTTHFFIRKFFITKWTLNPKTLRKCWENLQPQMPELQFSKTVIFPRVLWKLKNWVNFCFFLI